MSVDIEGTAGTVAARTRALRLGGAPTPSPKVRSRRRPWLFALMAALVAAGGLLGAYAYTSVDDTHAVLVLARDVARGATLEPSDVSVVRVSVDPALTPVDARDQSRIVGRRAATDLRSGTLLTQDAVAESVVPTAGQSMVGVSLSSAQMPSEQLYAGDEVRLVLTPEGVEGTSTPTEPVRTIAAVVVNVTQAPDLGSTVVDVTVPDDQAAELAAAASRGTVALVLDSRER